MSEELAIRESWGGAAERGLQARTERENIIGSVLKAGHDFGVIPGTEKPTLLKAGAEKIADSLNCYADYEAITSVEDWDKPLFYYRYRCVLRARGSDNAVVTGIGSCSSMEARYRWRSSPRKCPKCGKEAIVKGREEYGGGWLCFKKKDGCGAKFDEKDTAIIGQVTERVLNDDVYSLVNTIDKMAQKRSLVAAILNLGFSEQFTQDVEDMPRVEQNGAEEPVDIKTILPNAVVGGFTVQPHPIQSDDWLIPFGRDKGKSIREADNKELLYWLERMQKDVNDPAKAKYKPKNEDTLRILHGEKARRAAMAAEAEADAAALNDPNTLFADAEIEP